MAGTPVGHSHCAFLRLDPAGWRVAERTGLRTFQGDTGAPGVFAIRNGANGKVLVGASMNVHDAITRAKFELSTGTHHSCPALQEDWSRSGGEHFSFEALDFLPPSTDPHKDPAEELKALEAYWLARLGPYGDAGYNAPPE